MKGNDGYSLQLEFAALAAEIPQDEKLICLDYDHIVFRPDILAVIPPNDGLLVSSEFTETDIFSAYGIARDLKLFFNISLIVARCGILRQLRETWVEAYDELHFIPFQRHRVEYAFTLALSRKKLMGYPCEPLLQSNWRTQIGHPAMFHYGGETSSGKTVKATLTNLAKSTLRDRESLAQVHAELVACLNSLSSNILE
jgi:hypothetical protein